MATAREIRETVNAFLSRISVTVSVRYVGQTVRDGWECDAWRVSVVNTQTKGGEFHTDYFTGLGLRKKGRYMASLDWQQPDKPQTPEAADVLHSLCLDGEAVNASFSDWCADFGYDSDSIKALNTYQSCERIGRELRAMFGTNLAELQALVQEL